MSVTHLIALFSGLIFLALGILGFFFVPAGGMLLSILPTNTALEVVYLITGVLLAYAAFAPDYLSATSLLVGTVYALAAIGALVFPAFGLFSYFAVNGANIVFFLIVAVVMFVEWRGIPEAPTPSASR